MATPSELEARIRSYVLAEILPGEDPAQLTSTTPLVSSGLLDSIATLNFVSFLEKELDISIEAHEAGVDNFDTIERIIRLVQSKRSP
jgi:acyl carrier protein